ASGSSIAASRRCCCIPSGIQTKYNNTGGPRNARVRRDSRETTMSPYIAEFIGTAILVLLGNGAVANVLLAKTKGKGADLIVIVMGWAMAVFVAVYVTASFSGAHLNPIVTISLA